MEVAVNERMREQPLAELLAAALELRDRSLAVRSSPAASNALSISSAERRPVDDRARRARRARSCGPAHARWTSAAARRASAHVSSTQVADERTGTARASASIRAYRRRRAPRERALGCFCRERPGQGRLVPERREHRLQVDAPPVRLAAENRRERPLLHDLDRHGLPQDRAPCDARLASRRTPSASHPGRAQEVALREPVRHVRSRATSRRTAPDSAATSRAGSASPSGSQLERLPAAPTSPRGASNSYRAAPPCRRRRPAGSAPDEGTARRASTPIGVRR